MAIRIIGLLLTAGFAGMGATGVIAPGGAESFPSEPTALETAAVPAPRVDSGNRELEEGAGEANLVDPWADALAESARLNVLPRLRPEFPEYAVALNDDVRYFLDRFTGSRREVVEMWMGRSGRYLAMIREVFRSQGLPTDLAFTAMIESGFDARAVSRVGAKGLWQFMAPTARRYGLRVDRWVDERLDPEKSTVAAAAYLRDLYVQFGSWELAQAAYNAGEVTVLRAIRVTGSSDFWDLTRTPHLRRETRDFVPAIQAATLIGRDPDQYGFAVGGDAWDDTERVSVPPGTDLRRLATDAGLSLEMLRRLNPTLVRGITPPDTRWDVRIPPGTRDGVLAALTPRRPLAGARAPHRVSTTREIHVVRPQETVSSIAKLYGLSVADVLRWNRLENQDRIRPGDRLRIAQLR